MSIEIALEGSELLDLDYGEDKDGRGRDVYARRCPFRVCGSLQPLEIGQYIRRSLISQFPIRFKQFENDTVQLRMRTRLRW